MRRFSSSAGLVLILACVGTQARPGDMPAPSEVIPFNVTVRVDVDATGKPVVVKAPAHVPDAVRAYIEKRVASWQYQPARIDGVPQPSTTYVGVNACAVRGAEGYTLGLDFRSNGPAIRGVPKPPEYPRNAMLAGTEAEFVLILGIDGAGKVSLERIEREDISGRSGRKEFEPVVRRWVGTLRFDQETVAGKPTPAEVRMPVRFLMGGAYARRAREADIKSRECTGADEGSDLRPVALQPLVKVIPRPAG